MIKRYIQFIKEADEAQPTAEETQTESGSEETQGQPEEAAEESGAEEDKGSNKFPELKEEITSLIEKTIKSSGGEMESFKEKFIKNPEDVKIEGLINDSDVYEFYLKFRNDIDELLNGINFFDDPPSEVNSIGLYDYIIKGTEKAIIEIVKGL